MKFRAVESKTITKAIKAAKRPRYHSRDLDSTLEAAARKSLAFGCKVQIVATYYGYTMTITDDVPTPGKQYFETDGKTITLYERIAA